MNRTAVIGRNLARVFCLAFLGLVFAGCATKPKINWDSRIGTYTYNQAIMDYGPPDREANVDGGVVVSEWIITRGASYGHTGVAYGGYPTSVWVSPPSPDLCLRLTFDADRKLKAWKRVAR